jgi:hypothetical protein
MRLLIALFLIMLSVSLGHAQSSLQNQLSTQKLPAFSGNFSTTLNSNLYAPESYDHQSSASADLVVNYRVRGADLLRAYIGGYKEFTQGQEWKPNDGFLAWVNNGFWTRGKKLTIGQQVRFSLPLSRESRDRDSKVTGVSLVPIFMANVAPTIMFIYLPSVNRNFHNFQQNRLGNNNVEYSLGNLLVGIWSFSDKMYYQAVGGYNQAWSYGGTQRDPSFSFSNEIGYTLPKNFTIAAGWSNSGNIRRVEQGVDQSFEFFNRNTSTVYTALYWIF